MIMPALFHVGKMGSKYKVAAAEVKHLMQVCANRR